ncbi:hypothetical protein K439DRAFT_795776 [Ramaria rubella]|nr:hypothetical protein K439DRAFT_795776 [Ramaria rubella]
MVLRAHSAWVHSIALGQNSDLNCKIKNQTKIDLSLVGLRSVAAGPDLDGQTHRDQIDRSIASASSQKINKNLNFSICPRSLDLGRTPCWHAVYLLTENSKYLPARLAYRDSGRCTMLPASSVVQCHGSLPDKDLPSRQTMPRFLDLLGSKGLVERSPNLQLSHYYVMGSNFERI